MTKAIAKKLLVEFTKESFKTNKHSLTSSQKTHILDSINFFIEDFNSLMGFNHIKTTDDVQALLFNFQMYISGMKTAFSYVLSQKKDKK